MLLLSALVIADTGRCSSAMLPWRLANDSGTKLKLAVLQSNAFECYPSSTGANVTTFGSRKCRPGLNICPSHQRRSLTHTSMQEATYIDSWFSQHCLPCNHFLQLATGLHASRDKIFHRIHQSFLKVIVLRLSWLVRGYKPTTFYNNIHNNYGRSDHFHLCQRAPHHTQAPGNGADVAESKWLARSVAFSGFSDVLCASLCELEKQSLAMKYQEISI